MLFFVIFLFIVSSGPNGQYNNDLHRLKLKGPVLEKKETLYDYFSLNNGNPYANPAKTTFFNPKGYITQTTEANDEAIYVYDTLSRLKEIRLMRDAFLFSRQIFRGGLPDSILYYNRTGECTGGEINQYSKKGYLVSRVSINNNKQETGRFQYTYNSSGEKIKTEKFDSSGKLTLLNTFRYNKNGQELTIHSTDGRATVLAKELSEYDPEGNLVKYRQYTPQSAFVNITHFSYQYEYDHYKNWTRKTTFRNGKKDAVTERAFIYNL